MVKTKTKILLCLSIIGLTISLIATILLAQMLIYESRDITPPTHQVKKEVTPPQQVTVNSTASPVTSHPKDKTENSTSVKVTNTLTLQVGSYLDLNSAKNEAARVAGLGFRADVYVQKKYPPVYVVRTGNFTDITTASAEAKKIQEQGDIASSIVPVDKADLVPKETGIPLWLAQIGSFLTQQSAGGELARLKKIGIKASIVPLYDKRKKIWYAVLLGAFPDEEKAKTACAAFKEKENGDCIIYSIDKGIFETRKAWLKEAKKTKNSIF